MKDISRSIVTARNMGLEKHDRVQVHVQIEGFLLQTIDLKGLSRSDIINIALEKYLKQEQLLTEETLSCLSSLSKLDKIILTKGLF